LIAGAFTLAVGRIAIATMRSPFLRAAVALLFAVPAAVAGYHAALGLAQIGVPAEGWRQVFALLGAIAVGGTAWVRMALSASTESDRAMLPVRSLRSPWRRWPGTDERPLVTSVPMDCQTARRRLL